MTPSSPKVTKSYGVADDGTAYYPDAKHSPELLHAIYGGHILAAGA